MSKVRYDSIIGIPNKWGVIPIRTLHKDPKNGNLLYEFICPLCNRVFTAFGTCYARQRSCGHKCKAKKAVKDDPLYKAFANLVGIRSVEWGTFAGFKETIKEIPNGKCLVRPDKLRPIGPDNYAFAVKRPGVGPEASVVVTYRGVDLVRAEVGAVLKVTPQRISQLLQSSTDSLQKRIEEIPYEVVQQRLDDFYAKHRTEDRSE